MINGSSILIEPNDLPGRLWEELFAELLPIINKQIQQLNDNNIPYGDRLIVLPPLKLYNIHVVMYP